MGTTLWFFELISSAGDASFLVERGNIVKGFTTYTQYTEKYPNTVEVREESWEKFPEIRDDRIIEEMIQLCVSDFWEEHEYEALVTPRPRPWWKIW